MTFPLAFRPGFQVLPVCNLTTPEEASPLAEALLAGGVPVAEVTLRSPDALVGLKRLAGVDGLTVGAGTVRTAGQLHRAVDAGASFVVSPFLTEGLAMAARDAGVPFLPGAVTAREIQLAVDAGFTTVKFFPAEPSGGLRVLRALCEVFPEVRFVPTGGISASTVLDYLAHPQVVAVGGSWMLPHALRDAGDWAGVTAEVASCARLLASSP